MKAGILFNQPTGRAFGKPDARMFRDDHDIACWVMDTAEEMGAADDLLIYFMIASSVVGPDEQRLASMFHINPCEAKEWATNLRDNAIWQNGQVLNEDWFREDYGLQHFVLHVLAARGFIENPIAAARKAGRCGPQ